MKLKTLIVDDEPPARERLASLLAEIGDVLLVGEGGSGREALERVYQDTLAGRTLPSDGHIVSL